MAGSGSWTMLLRQHHNILVENEICKSIFKAVHQPSQRTICVKSCSLLSSSSLNEAYLLRTILYDQETQNIHPNILTLLSIKSLPTSLVNNSIYFIFDYANNRDLATHGLLYGGTERQLSTAQIRTYMYELLSAVIYCHDRLVYHCAIELKHLLITSTGHLKLSNFEYAKHAQCPIMTINVTEVRQLSSFLNAPPELLLGNQILTGALDMWSIGCIFAQLCSTTQIEHLFRAQHQIELLFSIFSMLGTPTEDLWPLLPKQPFYNCEFPRWSRRNEYLYELTKLFGSQSLDFLKNLLIYDPKQRLTAREAQQHSYFIG